MNKMLGDGFRCAVADGQCPNCASVAVDYLVVRRALPAKHAIEGIVVDIVISQLLGQYLCTVCDWKGDYHVYNN